MEARFDQEQTRLDDSHAATRRELQKTKDVMTELQKQHETLKKRYNEDVDKLRQNQEDELVSRSERVLELEQRCKNAEEALESAK